MKRIFLKCAIFVSYVCNTAFMPQKNTIKSFQPNTKYHVYNRGMLKSEVFRDDTDLWTFRRIVRQKLKKMSGFVTLEPFSLLPNHFHFKIWQKNERDIERFMRSVMTSYGMYSARRYRTTGHLFETIYKAVEITSVEHEKSIDNYILSNPINAGLIGWKHVGWNI